MVGIYKFTNKKNGKSYIGATNDLDRRYKEHATGHKDLYFDKIIVESGGIDNFDYEILENCTYDELKEKEIYYINKYNTVYPNGYNLTYGGNSGHLTAFNSFDDIKEVKRLLRYSDMSMENIGIKFNISRDSISSINNGYIWKSDDYEYPIRVHKCNKIPEKRLCLICGNSLSRGSYSGICRNCYNKMDKAVLFNDKHSCIVKTTPPVEKDELYELLKNNSFVTVANIYGVSDNAVRKWCDKYGIPRHSSYYRNLK